MPLVFTNDQEQFRESIQRFLADQMPTTKVRQLMATEHGIDPAVWQQASAQLALTGIHIPEAFGGAGFGAVELGIALEEMGESLFCGPYFSSAVLSAYALMLCGDEDEQEQWLGRIASGEQRACLAITERTGLWQQGDIATTAVIQSSGEALLNGKKSFVIDGQSADLFVVAAQSGRGIGLWVVNGRHNGMTVEALDTMDPTRKMAHINFVNVPATALAQLPDHWLDTLLNIACITLSAEMIGGTQRLLGSAVEYTQLRYQFGRSIASFQAIKHRLADLLLEVELARSAAYQAIETLADCADLQKLTAAQHRQLTEHASLAKAAVSETYLQAALETIQLHGGIGFTWENDTHLWFKRAKSSEVLFGTPAEHRERMLSAVEAGLHAKEDAA
jgi:alkylation response protein AidB-like acyl-CoA dehydrogenase